VLAPVARAAQRAAQRLPAAPRTSAPPCTRRCSPRRPGRALPRLPAPPQALTPASARGHAAALCVLLASIQSNMWMCETFCDVTH